MLLIRRVDTVVRQASRISTCLLQKLTVTCIFGAFYLVLLATQSASGMLVPGLHSNFESGTLEGWSANTFKSNAVNMAGGPAGSTRFLEVSPAPHLAVFTGEHFSGPTPPIGSIDPTVTAISRI